MQREKELERRHRRYAREMSKADQAEERREKVQREARENAARKAEKKRQKREAAKEEWKQKAPPSVPSWRAAHLATLGALEDTPAAIRAAYMRLALRYHPDKNSAANAAELFRCIKAAYDALLA